jgi:hypothetical protein
MKFLKTAAIVVGCGILGFVLCSVVLNLILNQNSELTESQIAAMFGKAGGVDKVNQEAKSIFDRFGTSKITVLTISNLNDFPAMTALGNSVILWPESVDGGKVPPHIEVRFGSHFNTRFVFIFETNYVAQLQSNPVVFRAASNIFVSK